MIPGFLLKKRWNADDTDTTDYHGFYLYKSIVHNLLSFCL